MAQHSWSRALSHTLTLTMFLLIPVRQVGYLREKCAQLEAQLEGGGQRAQVEEAALMARAKSAEALAERLQRRVEQLEEVSGPRKGGSALPLHRSGARLPSSSVLHQHSAAEHCSGFKTITSTSGVKTPYF